MSFKNNTFKNNIICEEFCREMWRYLDGSLSEEEKSFWDKHLDICSACRAALSEAEKGLSIFESLPLEDISDARFDQMIRYAAGKNRLFTKLIKSASFPFTHRRIVFSTAALAAVIAVMFIIYRPQAENPWKSGVNNTPGALNNNNEVLKGFDAINEDNPVLEINSPENIRVNPEVMEWRGEKMRKKINQVGYSIVMIDEYESRKSEFVDNWSMEAAELGQEIERLIKEINNTSF